MGRHSGHSLMGSTVYWIGKPFVVFKPDIWKLLVVPSCNKNSWYSLSQKWPFLPKVSSSAPYWPTQPCNGWLVLLITAKEVNFLLLTFLEGQTMVSRNTSPPAKQLSYFAFPFVSSKFAERSLAQKATVFSNSWALSRTHKYRITIFNPFQVILKDALHLFLISPLKPDQKSEVFAMGTGKCLWGCSRVQAVWTNSAQLAFYNKLKERFPIKTETAEKNELHFVYEWRST